MRCLVDTHIAVWLLAGSPRLSGEAVTLLGKPGTAVFVSDISTWEVAIKEAVNPGSFGLTSQHFMELADEVGMRRLVLARNHIIEYESLPLNKHHRDPFDRMLLAQAKAEGLTFVTHDARFAAYDDLSVLIV